MGGLIELLAIGTDAEATARQFNYSEAQLLRSPLERLIKGKSLPDPIT